MEDIFQKKHLFVVMIFTLFVSILWWFYSTEILKNGKPSPDQSVKDFGPQTHNASKFARRRQVQTECFIPSDEKLKGMDMKELMTIFHTYQDHFEFLCVDEKRIGSVFDGGKQVCMDPEIRPKPNNCLVYSFGSQNEFSFERDAIKWFGCEVHTFDPFTPNSGGTPKGCTFHTVGLGGTTRTVSLGGKGPQQIKSLHDIMGDLNHSERVIDILKVDIDLFEWEFMDNVIKTGLLGRKVKQYQVELHWYDQYKVTNRTNIEVTLGTLRNLYGAGFRIFSRERNVFCKGCTYSEKLLGTDVTMVTEFSYINEKFVSEFYDN